MRLLVVTNDFPPKVGGIENYTYSLVRRWPPADLTVVTRKVEGWEAFDRGEDFEIIRRDTDTLLPTAGLRRLVRGLVKDRSIDAVHFPSSLPLGMLGSKLGRPYVVSVHGGEFRLASRLPLVRGALKRVGQHASLILPENSYAAGLVAGLLNGAPQMTLHCGVDVDRYGKQVAPPADIGVSGPVILAVCRLIPRKGPRTLIELLPAVHSSHPNAHLLIVGGGPDLEHLHEMAESRGVGDSVTFAGEQPWDKVPCYYSAGDLFALPTRVRFAGTETEGLPLVFVEAAAAGLPVIGGNSGGVRDAVREGATGFLVDGNDPPQTLEAIVKLLDDPGLMESMGAAGRKMAEEEFSWDALAERYRDALATHCR